jgi:hypothetical protein
VRVARCALDRHHLAGQPFRLFGRDQERLDRPADLIVGIGDRKAGLGNDAIDEAGPVLGDERRGVMKDLIAALGVETIALERGARAGNGTVDQLARGARGDADRLAGELVEDGRRFAALDPFAIQEQQRTPAHSDRGR